MLTRLLTGLVLVFALGCTEGEVVDPGSETAGSEAEVTAMSEPVPVEDSTTLMIEDTEGPSLLDSAILRERESMEPPQDGETFEVGDQLEMVVTVKEVPPALAAWIYWLGPSSSKLAEEQKPVPESGVVTFAIDTAEWLPGAYTAEVYIGGDLVEARSFMLDETGENDAN